MKKISRYIKLILLMPAILLLTIFTAGASSIAPSDSVAIQGRWDITINIDGTLRPSWLEIQHSGIHTLVGRFVGMGGSARPISRINFVDDKMSFAIPPQWENSPNDLVVEGIFKGDSLAGTMTLPNGKIYNWVGKRAPSLQRKAKPVWGKSIHLFDGHDLKGWHATGKNQWQAEDGILQSPHPGSNLVTDKKFTDFKLHIEYRYKAGGNSGVYLRGRYEVQIEDVDEPEPENNQMGAVYGFLAPSDRIPRKPGTWQSYNITLIGRMVTIVANGDTIICNREIPGITGGALNSDEGAPGPILLQGDHEAIEYRNIIITPVKE